MNELNKIEKLSILYESQTWLRALVQLLLPVGGGSIDLLFSVKATKINNNRAMELIEQVSEKLQLIDDSKLNKNFLESEEFFDISRRCLEIATRTANIEKRKLIADYLSGVIQNSAIDDISVQILEDLNSLQEFHLQILVALPANTAGQFVLEFGIPEQLKDMPEYIFMKGISDLQRFGFLQYRHFSTVGGGSNEWMATQYLIKFKETFRVLN